MIATPDLIVSLNNNSVAVAAQRVQISGCYFPWEDNPYGYMPFLVDDPVRSALVWAVNVDDALREAEACEFVVDSSTCTARAVSIDFTHPETVARLAEARGAGATTLEGY